MTVAHLVLPIDVKQNIQQQHCFFSVLFFVCFMKAFSSGICEFSSNVILARAFLGQPLHQGSCCGGVRGLYLFPGPGLPAWASTRRRLRSTLLVVGLVMMMLLVRRTSQKEKQKDFLRRSEGWERQEFDDECARVTEKKKKKMHKKK